MAGSKAGGLKAAATNKAKFGDDFYEKIGQAGGAVRHPETRVFYVDRDLARSAGRTGGLISRKGKPPVRTAVWVNARPQPRRTLLQRLFGRRS